jgi:glucose-specific phosphotransferase system IIA component
MNFLKKKISAVVACCDGILDDLSNYPDEAIASKVMGEGYLIEPENGIIVAPISGEVVMVFPTGHAIGLKSKDHEVLIHIGVDTVNLNGNGFYNEVSVGDKVEAGQRICTVDLEHVRQQPGVKAVTTAVIFTGSNKKIEVVLKGQRVTTGQKDIIKIS